ncbi:hypothetical protein HDF16_003583 [Granulicella aggregans]|uniref:Uncharacterized protein n=1 Tax=Granulicella aggregans TaxID=474949 RepID=A0A7W7ZF73_9BACT|nr:hypothetical protein [Granulicella aggregans]MBB5058860.1 hypothetical protein [Granulicella aggregans]
MKKLILTFLLAMMFAATSLIPAGAIAQNLSPGAAKRVPIACIEKIQTDGAFDMLNDQLCPLYLILSSKQFRTMQQAQSKSMENTDPRLILNQLKSTLRTFVTEPADQQIIKDSVLSAYKTLSQQQGANSGASGTTNLVSKGAASQLLSLASEFGAVTQTTSGQTTTASGTLAGLPLALINKGALQLCPSDIYSLFESDGHCFNPKLVSRLNRVSYSVSFNTSSNSQMTTGNATGTGSTVPATFTSSSSPSINAVTAKWVVIQGKPTTANITAALKTYDSVKATGDAAGEAQYFKLREASINSTFQAWISQNSREPMSHNASSKGQADAVSDWLKLANSYVEMFSGLKPDVSPDDAKDNEFLNKAGAFAVAYTQTLAAEQTVAATMARPAVLSFEYDDNLPSGQPSNSVVRGIYQKKLGGWTMTANGAVSFYNSPVSADIAGGRRLRDFQFAAQADHDFSITLPTGKVGMTGTGAFYDQEQTSPAILDVTPGSPVDGVTFTGLPSTATQVYAKKGNIAVGQFRLTIGSGSNIHVPLSVTYSNRTELVTSPTWRGQIGITYDLDSLFQGKP